MFKNEQKTPQNTIQGVTHMKYIIEMTPVNAATTADTPINLGRPVLITTANRGVFFGYSHDTSGETVKLSRARLCVYWSEDCKGFMGLASTGPTANCRIGEPADIELRNVTSVTEVTAVAVTQWEAGHWSK
jgi:hypothetical protein